MIPLHKYISFAFIIVFSIVLTSCEKVVDLNLQKSNQQLVVEAIVHDSLGDNFVKLTKTRPFNDNTSPLETISGAIIFVNDNAGNSYPFIETAPGNYNCPILQGISGRIYTLMVQVEGKIITAQSTMYPNVNLDSLSQEKVDNPFVTNSDTINYRVKTHFYDTPNFTNYYRIKAFNKGVQEKGYIVLSDNLADGDHVVFPVFLSEFNVDDTVVVQLLSIDEVNFRYFNAIDLSQNGEVPGNPETNLIGEDVVGYFGAYAKSEKSIVITPEP